MEMTSTPSSKKFGDWAGTEIDEKKWLPMDVNIKSVASIIQHLDLRHLNVSDHPHVLDIVNEEDVIGFVCTSPNEIALEGSEEYAQKWSFIPVGIQNSFLTIQILNLCAVNGKFRDVTYGYMLEKYLKDSYSSSKENCILSNSVFAITPIPFAHNVTARYRPFFDKTTFFRNFPVKNSKQHVSVFAKLGDSVVQINENGHLDTFGGSDLPVREVMRFMKEKINCQVFTITEDPFKDAVRQLDSKKAELTQLLERESLNKSNGHLDDSFTFEDLKEISELNKEFEDADSFELIIEGTSSSSKSRAMKKSSEKRQNSMVHRLEEQIRQYVKEIEDIKKIFPHIYWPQVTDSDLYGSKEYLRFYAYYKKAIHASTPKLLKSYEFVPIRTPRPETESSSGSRKRENSVVSSLSIESSTSLNRTPKRRRSSRVSKN